MMITTTSAFAYAAFASPSYYPVQVERIALAAPSGQPLDDCRSSGGRLTMIVVTVKSLSNSVQPIAAVIIVELEDNTNGVTQLLQWQTMSINPNAEQQMAISFDPSSLPPSGQYEANIMIWNQVLAPMPLGSPSRVPINC
ncbi:MAG TPA: hypothetical protein VHA09_08085 [Nitrososphaera sp.]|nr:hypothetical protein [Nitrososphaera sp.]